MRRRGAVLLNRPALTAAERGTTTSRFQGSSQHRGQNLALSIRTWPSCWCLLPHSRWPTAVRLRVGAPAFRQSFRNRSPVWPLVTAQNANDSWCRRRAEFWDSQGFWDSFGTVGLVHVHICVRILGNWSRGVAQPGSAPALRECDPILSALVFNNFLTFPTIRGICFRSQQIPKQVNTIGFWDSFATAAGGAAHLLSSRRGIGPAETRLVLATPCPARDRHSRSRTGIQT